MDDENSIMIDEFNLLQSVMNVQEDLCSLWHHKDEKLPHAIDYIVQDLGFNDAATQQIRIPLCQQCINALNSGEWVLFYCIGCNESRWHNKEMSKHEWENNTIKFFDVCPCCKK